MGSIKKFLFIILTGVPGVVLTLAGVNVIEFTAKTQQYILYLGLFLLAVAILSALMPSGRKEKVGEKAEEKQEE